MKFKEKLILIITSLSRNSGRFVANSASEWAEAWGFDVGKNFAYRTKEQRDVKCSDSWEDIPKENFPLFVWINTQRIKDQGVKNLLNGIGESLEPVRIAYHDLPPAYIPEKFKNTYKDYSLLEPQKKQFEKIIKTDSSGKKYLDATEDLEKIYSSFFLNISDLLYHITHVFLPLDIDLQGICEVLSPTFIPPSDKSKEGLVEEYYKEAFPKSPKEIFEEKLEKAKEIVKSEAPDEIKTQILDKLKNNGLEELKGQLGNGPKGGLEAFRSWAKENKNPFHSWFCELIECLNKIKVGS